MSGYGKMASPRCERYKFRVPLGAHYRAYNMLGMDTSSSSSSSSEGNSDNSCSNTSTTDDSVRFLFSFFLIFNYLWGYIEKVFSN